MMERIYILHNMRPCEQLQNYTIRYIFDLDLCHNEFQSFCVKLYEVKRFNKSEIFYAFSLVNYTALPYIGLYDTLTR